MEGVRTMAGNDLTFEFDNVEKSRKQIVKEIFSKPFDHLRSGISYMLPFILIGGIITAVSSISNISDAPIWSMVASIGQVGMTFFIPIFGAYIAFSIADKAGIAPGFICAYLANTNGSGYIGALLAGFLVGYVVALLKKLIKPNKILQGVWDYFVPAFSTLAVGLFIIYVINAPVARFTDFMVAKLSGMDAAQGGIAGLILGALGGVDYGGPISKIGTAIMFAGFDKGIYLFVGIAIAIAMVPPFGFTAAAFIAPKLFTKSERRYARTSWPIVLIGGFTELALPLVINDIIRCTIASFLGCLVSGFLAGFFGLELSVPALGLASWFFISFVPVYALCVVAGAAVTAAALIFLRKIWPRKNFDPDSDDEVMSL